MTKKVALMDCHPNHLDEARRLADRKGRTAQVWGALDGGRYVLAENEVRVPTGSRLLATCAPGREPELMAGTVLP